MALFLNEVNAAKNIYDADTPFCVALSEDRHGALYSITLSAHLSRGIKGSEPEAPAHQLEQKYNYTIPPLNRLMIGAHKYGHRVLDDYIYLSHIPSGRELINLMGEEGQQTLYFDKSKNMTKYSSPKALMQLTQAGLVKAEYI